MEDLQKDNVRLKQQLKLTKAFLVTTILEGNKSDLLDKEGSSNFNLVMELMQDRYPDLRDGIVLAHTTKVLDLWKVILIDIQMTHDVFCTVKYVENVRKANCILQLSTNGGGMSITHEADVKGFYPEGYDSTVYYDMDAINNILITYDSDISKTFTIHQKSHGLVNLHFTMHPCGLHILEHGNAGSMFVQTVEDNLQNYKNNR